LSWVFLQWPLALSPSQLQLGSSYLYFPCNWHDRCEPQFPTFIGWDRVLRTFCLGWPQTVILLISASQVTRIISVNHCTWLFLVFWRLLFPECPTNLPSQKNVQVFSSHSCQHFLFVFLIIAFLTGEDDILHVYLMIRAIVYLFKCCRPFILSMIYKYFNHL
jgi:hypothetical protein